MMRWGRKNDHIEMMWHIKLRTTETRRRLSVSVLRDDGTGAQFDAAARQALAGTRGGSTEQRVHGTSEGGNRSCSRADIAARACVYSCDEATAETSYRLNWCRELREKRGISIRISITIAYILYANLL